MQWYAIRTGWRALKRDVNPLSLPIIDPNRSISSNGNNMLQVNLSVSKHLCHCFINVIHPCVSMEVCETQNIFMKFSLFFIKKSDKDHELCIVCVVCGFIHSQ